MTSEQTHHASRRYYRPAKVPKSSRDSEPGRWVQVVFAINIVIALIVFGSTLGLSFAYMSPLVLVSVIASGWSVVSAIALWKLAADSYENMQ